MSWIRIGTEDFLAFDATLDLGQVRFLADKIAPRFVVVRMDDENPSSKNAVPKYFVFSAVELFAEVEHSPEWETLGDLVRDRDDPAVVIETDDGWMRYVDNFDIPMNRHAVVVDDDGIVEKVVPDLQVVISDGTDTSGVVAADKSWRHLHPLEPAELTGDGSMALLGPDLSHWREVTEGDELEAGDEGTNLPGGGGTPPPDDGINHGGGAFSGGDDGDTDLRPMALEVEFADAVKLGERAPLLVLLEPGPGGPGSAPVSVKVNEVLEIMVSPTTGFTLVDERSKRMTVLRDDQTLPVKFDLLASTAGKGTARVYAFRDGTCVASLSVSADIVLTTPEPTNRVPARLPLPAAVKADADLDLMVFKESFRGGIALTYRLTDRANVSSNFGPHTLDSDPSAYVHAKFAEIQEINRTARAWGNAERIRLERIGSELYESLVPPDLQEILWNSDRVRSFLVQTEEPWIPWELCRMTITRGDGSTEARGFLCDLYELSRWLPGTPPKTALRATRIGVIAPSDRWLPTAPAEVEMLKALSASGPEVDRVRETYVSVIEALQSHRYDVLHFVGHGKNLYPEDAERSEFLLSGRWRLRPTDISGETKNFGLASPVVFMNACEVAQASMGLHGIGGWASAMTKAGAGAFIGTHWDVRDDLAETFAATFYAKLMGSPTMTIAGAAHAARQVLKQRPDSDATWLAYSVHASPGATCSFSSPTP